MHEAVRRIREYAKHCREGFRLTRTDADYRAEVAASLAREGDAFSAVWKDVEADTSTNPRARALQRWMLSDEGFDVLQGEWDACAEPLPALRSVLSSHPYAGAPTWPHRRKFRTSSPTPPA